MAAPIPSTEPAAAVSGDTISWLKSVPDYLPTDGWALTYALRYEAGGGSLNLTGAASGNDYSLTISAASSNLMKAGMWLWDAYVTLSGVRHTIGSGSLDLKPNLAKIDSSPDLRSSAKRAFDNAMAAWESVKLGQTVMLNGRTYTQHNLDALTRYVDRCRADYAAERTAEQIALTGVNPRRIGVRFTRV